MARIAPPVRLYAPAAEALGGASTVHIGGASLTAPPPNVQGDGIRSIYAGGVVALNGTFPTLSGTGTTTAGTEFIFSGPVSVDSPAAAFSAVQHSKRGFLLNDFLSANYSLSFLSPPLYGTFQYTDNGSYRYGPDPVYVGVDIFTYQVTDAVSTDSATFTVQDTGFTGVSVDQNIPNITLSVNEDWDMSQYINDPLNERTGSSMTNLGSVAIYDDTKGSEKLTGLTAGSVSGVTLNVETGVQDLIHNDLPYDHAAEPLGLATADIPDIWNYSDTATYPPSDSSIVNTNLMIPGTKQWRTSIVKQGSGQWRTERASAREPRTTSMVSVGGGHYVAPQKYWYGFLLRIDENSGDWNKGHYCQWHGASSLGGGHSPFVAVTGRQGGSGSYPGRVLTDGLEVYIEAVKGQGDPTYHSGTLPEMTAANLIGIPHAFIWEIFWDSRTDAVGGSQAITRLYLDDNPVPIFEQLGKMNCVAGDLEHVSSGQIRVPFFKYGLYKSNVADTGSDGDTYTQHYQNYVVHGENANLQGVLDSLRWSEVT